MYRYVPFVFKRSRQTFNARLTDGTQFTLRREPLRSFPRRKWSRALMGVVMPLWMAMRQITL